MKKEIPQNVVIAVVVIIVLLIGGFFYMSNRSSSEDQNTVGLRKPGEKPIRPKMGGGSGGG